MKISRYSFVDHSTFCTTQCRPKLANERHLLSCSSKNRSVSLPLKQTPYTQTHTQTLSTYRIGSSDVAPLTLTIRMSARSNNRCICLYASFSPYTDTSAFPLSTSGIPFLTGELLGNSTSHFSFCFRSARLTCPRIQSESLKPGVTIFFSKI